MKKIGREFLKETNDGLDIFKKYVQTPFKLDEWTQNEDGDWKLHVHYHSHYKNYVINLDYLSDGKWIREGNFNAIWFVKWYFDLSEEEVYQKLENEMDLGIVKKTGDRKSVV